MKRIYSFDFLKLILAIEIALYHYGETSIPGAFTAVEFFFILSGFFMAKKFFSSDENGAAPKPYEYTKSHIKSLYSYYIFALIVIYIYLFLNQFLHSLNNIGSVTQIAGDYISRLYNSIPEVFLLQDSGIFTRDVVNYPTWQLCVLIIVSHFIYTLLYYNKKLTINILCPLLAILVYGYLSSSELYATSAWATDGCFYIPLLRCLGALCIGVILYKLAEKIIPAIISKKVTFLFNAVTLLSCVLLPIMETQNNIHLILSCLIILGCYYEKSWINVLLNRNIFKSFGKLSYSVYLNHALLIYVFTDAEYFLNLYLNIKINEAVIKSIFVIVLLAYSVLTTWLVGKITQRGKTKKHNETKLAG